MQACGILRRIDSKCGITDVDWLQAEFSAGQFCESGCLWGEGDPESKRFSWTRCCV